MTKNRLDYLDVSKGLGILFIVFFHTTSIDNIPYLYKWLRSFSVIIFYFISGYLLSYTNKTSVSVRECIKKRLRSLILPYLYFSLIIIAFDTILVLLGFYDKMQIVKDIFMTITLRGIGTLWFLPSLFIGEVIFHTFKINGNHKSILVKGAISVVIAIIISIIVTNLNNGGLIFDILSTPFIVIAKGLFAVTFIILGYYFNYFHEKFRNKYEKKQLLSIGFISLIFGFLLSQFNIMTDINHAVIGNPLLYLVCGIFSSVGWILTTECVSNKGNIILRISKFYGKNSLIVMLTHYSLLIPIIKSILNVVCEGINVSVFQTILFLMVVLFQIPIIFIINKYLGFLISKKSQSILKLNNKVV